MNLVRTISELRIIGIISKVGGLLGLNWTFHKTETRRSSIKLDGQNDLNWTGCESERS